MLNSVSLLVSSHGYFVCSEIWIVVSFSDYASDTYKSYKINANFPIFLPKCSEQFCHGNLEFLV